MMRRQYHARQTEGGQLIWDVHRLLRCARDLPVQQIALDSIAELDEVFWFDGIAPTCRAVAQHAKLIAETDLQHPIILSADGRVMDGMHRVCKALLEGHTTISALRFERDPDPDYVDVDLNALPYDEPVSV